VLGKSNATHSPEVTSERQGKMVLEIEGLSLERGGARLSHELVPTAGSLRRGSNTRTGYLDQQRSGLDAEQTVFESLGDQSEIDSGGQTLEVASYLERFLFDRRAQRTQVGELPGGERAPLCLAHSPHERATSYSWTSPPTTSMSRPLQLSSPCSSTMRAARSS
jgi:ATPase subunit of ABC transporter with duplicated ATPase domains